ncbi:hypothetical protein KC660_01290, partial [Candidatus Dojkabacteria bacterium]|nr:hypothetical protein [Candidatus Dojkabacteria bacterium]
DSKNILKYIERIEEVCSYPLIVKDINGSGGKHSAHITNREELLKEYNSLPKHKKYMFQSYIVNDYDWGVMVANGRIVSAEKSYKLDGEFRNNAAQGAEEVFVKAGEIPENIKEIASRASEALKLTWSRSDILIQKDTGKAFLLEVNRFPGITSGSTEVTGAQQFIMSHLNSIQD